MRRIADVCYDHAVQILREHRYQLDSLAEARPADAEYERQPVASGDSGRSDLETERR